MYVAQGDAYVHGSRCDLEERARNGKSSDMGLRMTRKTPMSEAAAVTDAPASPVSVGAASVSSICNYCAHHQAVGSLTPISCEVHSADGRVFS